MKEKITIFVFSLFLFCTTGKTQTISLAFSGLSNGQTVPLEKIKIENLDKSCDTTLFYPNSSIILQVMGIDHPVGSPEGLTVFQNSPNPVTEKTSVKIFNPATDYVSVVVVEIDGKQVCSYYAKLERGYHIFNFSPGNHGIFIFSVSTTISTQTVKVTSIEMKENGISSLQYSGKVNNEYIMKEDMSAGFVFFAGDSLRYTGYYNSITKVLEDTPQNNKTYTFEFSSSGFTCGQILTISHSASGGIAPVSKTITYRTVNNIPGETTKCWITSNLGSDHQATVVNDATEASAGWYWQFNRKQGYKHDGTTRTPNSTWISSINENTDWLTSNDPCNLELGTQWRLPTYTEWYNVDNTGGWTNWNGSWGSGLKLHAAGALNGSNGALATRGSFGGYLSSTQRFADFGWSLVFNSGTSGMSGSYKDAGYSVRCLRDN